MMLWRGWKKMLLATTLVGALCGSPRSAEALTEACLRGWICSGRGFEGALRRLAICLPLMPLCAMADVLSEPVFATDGSDHFVGFEKEIDIRLGGNPRPREGLPFSHNLFVTPGLLSSVVQRKSQIYRLRAGYHFELHFGQSKRGARPFGLSTGAGISAGWKRTAGLFLGLGPDLKWFYQFLPHSRFVVGARVELQTIRAWQLDTFVGVATLF